MKHIEYGTVSGNITYHYNQYKGYVADTGAKVILLPNDGNAKSGDVNYLSFIGLDDINSLRKKNIYAAKVDGTGNYTIDHIPEGEYLVLIISNNCKIKPWFDAFDDAISDASDTYYEEIVNSYKFNNYLNDTTAFNLAKSIAFYNYSVSSVIVYGNSNTTVSHAFPYTYI